MSSLPNIIKIINPPIPYILSNATANFTRPFVPTDLADLALWLDGADSNQFNYSSGSNISVWKDKSTNSNNASPAAVSNAPVYDINLSGVVFSNANSGTGGTIQGLTTTYTGSVSESMFVILTLIDGTNDNVIIYGNNSPARVAYIDTLSNLTIGSNGLSSKILSGGVVEKNKITLVDVLFNNGTKLNNYVNGLNSASTISFSPFIQTAATSIGTDNYIGSNGYNGYINEIIIYSNMLSDSDREKVESYLAWKWGVSLDPSNPYYQTAYSNYQYPFIDSNILLSNPVYINNTLPITTSSYPLISNYFVSPYTMRNIQF